MKFVYLLIFFICLFFMGIETKFHTEQKISTLFILQTICIFSSIGFFAKKNNKIKIEDPEKEISPKQ